MLLSWFVVSFFFLNCCCCQLGFVVVLFWRVGGFSFYIARGWGRMKMRDRCKVDRYNALSILRCAWGIQTLTFGVHVTIFVDLLNTVMQVSQY